MCVCMRRKYSEKSKEGGVLRSGDGERREAEEGYINYNNEEIPAKTGGKHQHEKSLCVRRGGRKESA